MQISEIWVSQRKLRCAEQIGEMITSLTFGATLPPVVLTRDEIGSIQLDDGHHRVVAIWLSGRRYLKSTEFVIVESDRWRPRFGHVPDLMKRCGIWPDGETEITPGF
ncbi:MAG: hypothetical protein DWQ34_07800 [Planctomycetota bacterium]|nr:MAG: hypothetical protein DWQ34_07800 [Planctomycetota bacterium]REK31388.1 MAG: hypothetical protein DWQ41_00740 [Planctomycetota bacterium]REK39111.1 MAG: hypothetical protein DWQ45_02775 [Planctomycetota bacterium]